MQNLVQFIPKHFGLQLKDYLPNLVGTVLANVVETLIEFGNHLVKWIGPFMSSVEVSHADRFFSLTTDNHIIITSEQLNICRS